MANNIAPEWPVNNDALWWCEITKKQVNVTTGDIEEVDVIDATDVKAFVVAGAGGDLLTKGEADAIHADLVFTLTCPTGTNRYFCYPQGDVAATRLLPSQLDEKVFIHFVKGTGDWHEVAETTVVNKRTAT